MRPGVHWTADRTSARVWAPLADEVEVVLEGRQVRLTPAEQGWFEGAVEGAAPGDRYLLRLDGHLERPDPASLSQPDGVHGPSAVVDLAYDWSDEDWTNPPLHEQVIYELHVGTFSPDGTFDGVRERLSHLVDLGVTAVELMPVAQFPGSRNWGYDGVDLYAVQHSYGGPKALQRLVDACHAQGLAVVLDVVYNHLGPEGNYLRDFGPYFTDRYRTPWGEAVNLDGPGSDHVRRFFVENALMWIDEFHVDALRLDAVHALFDQSARPFLAELAQDVGTRAASLGRSVDLIAENAANDPRTIRSADVGGLGLDAAWNDDFHHALHVALTGERAHYYVDFAVDPMADLTAAVADGYVNAGRYSPYRGRHHGASSADLPRSSLVVFSQNHDQVGNRAHGERLNSLVDEDRARFAAALTLLSPWVPMLFMGEEWAEVAPFLYFVDHGDEELNDAVRRGRAEEFSGFFDGTFHDVPDPSARRTFETSVLDWALLERPEHRSVVDCYRTLIELRQDHPSIGHPDPDTHRVDRRGTVIFVDSTAPDERCIARFNASADAASAQLPSGDWDLLVDAGDLGAKESSAGPRLPGWGFSVHRERRKA